MLSCEVLTACIVNSRSVQRRRYPPIRQHWSTGGRWVTAGTVSFQTVTQSTRTHGVLVSAGTSSAANYSKICGNSMKYVPW